MSSYDPLDLRGQEQAQADRELREQLAKENENEDIKWLMSDKRGRRMLWRLMDQSGVFRSTFNTNALAMAFAEGNRFYGLRVMQLIHVLCPKLYPVMVKENSNERTNSDGSGNNQ